MENRWITDQVDFFINFTETTTRSDSFYLTPSKKLDSLKPYDVLNMVSSSLDKSLKNTNHTTFQKDSGL